jgi:NADH dehydrogenase FAD-containing subunit
LEQSWLVMWPFTSRKSRHQGPSRWSSRVLSYAQRWVPSPKPAEMIKRKLEKLGVKVILNDRVKTGEDGKMTLESNGEEIKADAVVMTIGNKPINSFIQESSWLDEKGWVQVDEFFRVKGAGGKVFAVGDCSNLLMNAAAKVLANGDVLGKNIKATLDAISAGKDLDNVPMKKHVNPGDQIATTIGPKDGVAKIGSMHTQFMLPWFKNSTMFFFKIKGDLGLK